VVLMGWICHSIFVQEAQVARQQAGQSWTSLSTWEQFQEAWRIGPPRLLSTLYLVSPLSFGVSLVFMGATLGIGVIRWQIFLRLQGILLDPRRVTQISFIAHFFNSFLLGSTGGDLLKALYAARATRHKKAEAATTVFVDRLVGFSAMLLFAGGMMPLNLRLLSEHSTLRWLAGLTLAFLTICLAIAFLALIGGVSSRWPAARQHLRRLPKGDLIIQCLEACRRCGRSPAAVLRALLLSMVLNTCCVLQVMAIAYGLGQRIDPLALCLVVPMIICVSALPITPSGLGVRENLYVLVLQTAPFRVPAAEALAISLLAYAGSLLWSALGGIVYALESDREAIREAAHGNLEETV
jgi:hypothetical protein